MILLIIASFFLCQVRGKAIIGGQTSQIYSYPWLASIQKDGYHKCGGSIISDSVILTAAHCTKNPPYIVRVGSTRTDTGGLWHNVVMIKRHENYTHTAPSISKAWNDVALIKVSPPIKLGRYGALVELPRKGSVLAGGTNVKAVGWGSVSLNGEPVYELKSADLQIVDSGTCARSYLDETGTLISSNHRICASGREFGSDSCTSDSGGPLVRGDQLVGIISTGIGCANFQYPGIYEDVAYYRDWIDRNTILLTSH